MRAPRHPGVRAPVLALGLLLGLLPAPTGAEKPDPTDAPMPRLRWLCRQLIAPGDARALSGRLGQVHLQVQLPDDRALWHITPGPVGLQSLELTLHEVPTLPPRQTPEVLGVIFTEEGAPTVGQLRAAAGPAFTRRRSPSSDGTIPTAVTFRLDGAVVDVTLQSPLLWTGRDPVDMSVLVRQLRLYTPAAAVAAGLVLPR